jgi:hypothetical protein
MRSVTSRQDCRQYFRKTFEDHSRFGGPDQRPDLRAYVLAVAASTDGMGALETFEFCVILT